jgi:flagellar biosynthetic protein FliP
MKHARRLCCALAGAFAGTILLAFLSPALAQDVSINFGQGTGLTERVIQLIALITVLSIAPAILVMITSFTRIVIVLSLLRSAIGVQSAPPNMVVVSLALFLTAFVMGPAFQTAYEQGVQPLVAGQIQPQQAFERGIVPFLVIDLVIASVLMSMGMMMLPPAMISLPFKLIFFVLVDGWSLIAGSLVQSFVT